MRVREREREREIEKRERVREGERESIGDRKSDKLTANRFAVIMASLRSYWRVCGHIGTGESVRVDCERERERERENH